MIVYQCDLFFVWQGELVYIHYGRAEDFQYVISHGMPLEGKVALLRLGQGTVKEKVGVYVIIFISRVLTQ